MPQVQRVGDGTEEQQGARAEEPRDRRRGVGIGAGQDHGQRGAHRNERPRPGEVRRPVDHDPAETHREEPRDAEHGAHPAAHHDPPDQQARQRTHPELPEPGRRVVVGPSLPHGADPRRVHERRGRRHQQRPDQHGPHRVRSADPTGDRHDHHDEDDRHHVELRLHRHRPQVLQWADGRVGGGVVRRGGGQFPVLDLGQGREDLPRRRVPRRERQQGRGPDPDGEQHHRHRGIQAPGRAGYDGAECTGLGPAEHHRREEESGQDEEDVDTAGHPPEPDVEHHHQGDGEPA